jgi:hypothetical protein
VIVRKVGDWALGPFSSLDLNPIKNLWHILHLKVHKYRPEILKKEELMSILIEESDKVDIRVINQLIDNIP